MKIVPLLIAIIIASTSCTKEIQKTLTLHEHDTITVIHEDTVLLRDTLFFQKPFVDLYQGDSVSIFIWTDSATEVLDMEVDDMTTEDPNAGYTRSFNGTPINHMITVPAYPLSVIYIDIKYSVPRNCWVDLAGWQDEHVLTDHIPFTGQGRATFNYVIIKSIFNIYVR